MIITITNENYEEVARILLNAAQKYIPKNTELMFPSIRDLKLEQISSHTIATYYDLFLDNEINPFAIINGWDKEEGYPMRFFGDNSLLDNLRNELPTTFSVDFTIDSRYYELAKNLYTHKKAS